MALSSKHFRRPNSSLWSVYVAGAVLALVLLLALLFDLVPHKRSAADAKRKLHPQLPERFAVSFVLRPTPGVPPSATAPFLLVQRPANDTSLPNVWGLPAGMVATGAKGGPPTEAEWEAAVVRAGLEKLGAPLRVVAPPLPPSALDIAEPVLGELKLSNRSAAEGTVDRAALGYRLRMRQYDVELAIGSTATPNAATAVDAATAALLLAVSVPQPVANVTQYQAVRVAAADAVRPAAKRGSLCSRLYLRRVAAAAAMPPPRV